MRAAILLATAIFISACEAGPPAARAPAARDSLRLVVVTHGQAADPFWSIVANGVKDAAADLGVRVEYQAPPSFDMVRMNELIRAAAASKPHGLIVSIPDAAALGASIRSARARLPVLSINSGADAWKALGLLAHLGQTEYEAGLAAGERLAASGAQNVLCINHEVGNSALDERCRGLGDALSRRGARSKVLAVDLADPADAQQRIGNALATVDGLLTLGPGGAMPALAALRAAGRKLAFGTFDLDPAVLAALRTGELLFAIDQQPYLQGYLAVVLLTKYIETGTMAGGGEVVRTGPSLVTRETAASVLDLSARGIR